MTKKVVEEPKASAKDSKVARSSLPTAAQTVGTRKGPAYDYAAGGISRGDLMVPVPSRS